MLAVTLGGPGACGDHVHRPSEVLRGWWAGWHQGISGLPEPMGALIEMLLHSVVREHFIPYVVDFHISIMSSRKSFHTFPAGVVLLKCTLLVQQ